MLILSIKLGIEMQGVEEWLSVSYVILIQATSNSLVF